MQIANEWADGEDYIRNERAGTPGVNGDQGSWSHRNSDRHRKRKSRVYEDTEGMELVAAGFTESREQRNHDDSRYERDSRTTGYKGSKEVKREWWPRESRGGRAPRPPPTLHDACRFHMFRDENGVLTSKHLLKD